jgi:hypothetical protein
VQSQICVTSNLRHQLGLGGKAPVQGCTPDASGLRREPSRQSLNSAIADAVAPKHCPSPPRLRRRRRCAHAHAGSLLRRGLALISPPRFKAAPVATWLAHPKRDRWHLHFTPTSSSWPNLVASWFSQLTSRRLKKGTFSSVTQLEGEIGIWPELERRPATLHLEEVSRRDHREGPAWTIQAGFSQISDGPLVALQSRLGGLLRGSG